MPTVDSIWDSLTTDPISNLLFFVIGVIITILLFFIGSRERKPTYAIKSFNIVESFSNIVKSMKMLYEDEQIENLTVTKIAILNRGRKSIRREDVSTSEPIQIHISEGYKILDAKFISIIEKANQFNIRLTKDRSHFIVDFEYMDKDQGVVIQMFHTGLSDEDIEISGKFKEAKPFKRQVTPTIYDFIPMGEKINRNLFNFGIICMIIFFFGIFFYAGEWTSKILLLAILGTNLGFAYYMYSTRLPKGFEKFEEDF